MPWKDVTAPAFSGLVLCAVLAGCGTEPPFHPLPDEERQAMQARYLDWNAARQGWSRTPDGLEYRRVGAPKPGGARPAMDSIVTVQCEGRFLDGSPFFATAPGKPLVGPLGALIKGWQEGLRLMRVGETFEFALPPALAYGDKGWQSKSAAIPSIPPQTALLSKSNCWPSRLRRWRQSRRLPMTFHRICARLLSAIAVAILLAAPQARAQGDAQAPRRPMVLDDMLAMERIGKLVIAGGGRLVVFEKGGPREGFADYGIDEPAAGGRIYVFDRSKPAAPRRLLTDFAFPNWIGSASPDGGKLAVYWLEQEQVRAGVVDLATGKLTKFSFNPTFDFQQSDPLWISDDEILYAASPKDTLSSRIDFRRRAALMEADAWQRSWHGQPSASVIESHGKDFTPDWRPGSILRVNARSGQSSVLAEGKYVELSLSPDRRYLAAARQGYYLRFRPDSGKEVYDAHRLETASHRSRRSPSRRLADVRGLPVERPVGFHLGPPPGIA